MIQDFKVKPLFGDQFHERHQFTLNIDGCNYQGIYHDGEIQWFHPQPINKLEKDDFEDLELDVYDLMTDHINKQGFKVKPLFEDQFHERQRFTLNIEGDNYQGIFHNGKIQWFHPQPETKLEEDDLRDLESKVYDLMTNHAYQDINVKPLFEDQFHERHQFTLNIEGDNYQGIFHGGEIQWFHPQPNAKLEEDDLQDLESKVHDLMTNHLEQ
ncbi:DUF5342 family protein [Metabacillus litoralis]|uniref:DUF5342 family protein n=1 Tax=Metabacillus litoralis TaxID=152268 RepID=UPI00203D72A0|nr:DUF5342 family protein [Metabacillus litoralis]MCM3651135.1 YheE family protein [Metabacillus litoralis]